MTMSFRVWVPFLIIVCMAGCGRNFGERINVLMPDGAAEFRVMDFSVPLSLDPISPGWVHRTFFWHGPMQIEFVNKDGRAAVRLSTDDTASMFARHVDIPLATYPMLRWQWYVEQPIESDTDESTREGDDHPARFFIIFETNADERRAMEIIWGNKLQAGEYKYIGDFPHYVARGGFDNVGRWFDEEINLQDIYNTIWPDATPARLTILGLFCDSDNTDLKSTAYFSDVRMGKGPPGTGE